MDCSTPGFPVHHQLPEPAQTHVHWVGDAIQPSHPLSSPTPPAFSLSHHQGLFQWVSSMLRSQRIGASAAASVLPVNIQGWFSLGLTDLLAVQGILKSLLQHHSSKASVLQCSTLFMVQLSHLYMTTGKTIALALIIKAKFVIVTQLSPTQSTVYLALVSHPLLSDSSWMLFLDDNRTLYLPSFSSVKVSLCL